MGLLYVSRRYIENELTMTRASLKDKDFKEDVRTAELFVQFAAQVTLPELNLLNNELRPSRVDGTMSATP